MAKKLVSVTVSLVVEADYYVWADDGNEDAAVDAAERAEVLSTCEEFQNLNQKKDYLEYSVGGVVEDPSFAPPELILNPEDAPAEEQQAEAQVQWQRSSDED